MPLSDLSASDIESISSADTQGDKITDPGCGADEPATNPGVKHPRFFFKTGFISFLVEKTLYRVHDYLFTTNSSFWSQKLAMPRDDATVWELDVTKADMDALLAVLYNRNFQGQELKTYTEWESVLRLSTRWEFGSVRALAIEMLGPLASPVQKLVLGRSCDVPQWLQPALISLCMRKEPLTIEEGNVMSMSDVIALVAAREAVRKASLATPKQEDVSSYVAKGILGLDSSIPVLTPDPALPSSPLLPEGTPASEESPLMPPLPILCATPSTPDVHCLLSALNDGRYDDALEMITEESVRVFVDILLDFTTIWKMSSSSRLLVKAILRRGSADPSFIPTGIKL